MKTSILALVFPALVAAAQDVFPHINSEAFDNGNFGAYPNRTYITEPTTISPRLNVLQSDPRCNDGLYTMISLRGDKVELKGQSPMIHDARGNLIWMNATYGETFGLSVQKYKGQDYLTFWQGDDSVGGHGEGYYYLVSRGSLFLPRSSDRKLARLVVPRGLQTLSRKRHARRPPRIPHQQRRDRPPDPIPPRRS